MNPTEDETEEPVTCSFCGMTVPDVDTAVAQGWEPYHRSPSGEHREAVVCGKCAKKRMTLDQDGTLRLVADENQP